MIDIVAINLVSFITIFILFITIVLISFAKEKNIKIHKKILPLFLIIISIIIGFVQKNNIDKKPRLGPIVLSTSNSNLIENRYEIIIDINEKYKYEYICIGIKNEEIDNIIKIYNVDKDGAYTLCKTKEMRINSTAEAILLDYRIKK